MDNKHEFAIYCDQLPSNIQIGNVIELRDEHVVNRVRNILRLEPNESIILFDDNHHISATITAIKKSSVTIKINSISASQYLKPHITVLLPLLKREAMEQSFAAMCELGVTNVVPIVTAKSQRGFDQKDIDRAHKIMRAAAEQSKQFAIPQLLPTATLEQALAGIHPSAEHIFFDANGEPLKNHLDRSPVSSDKHYVCLVGPEGDLTAEEKEAVRASKFGFVKLTPTVLRSWQSVFLSVGIIRSTSSESAHIDI